MRYELAGIPTARQGKNKRMRNATFDESIRALTEAGLIPSGDVKQWEATQKLRNLASDPDFQSIRHPAAAMRILRVTAAPISRLFPSIKR